MQQERRRPKQRTQTRTKPRQSASPSQFTHTDNQLLLHQLSAAPAPPQTIETHSDNEDVHVHLSTLSSLEQRKSVTTVKVMDSDLTGCRVRIKPILKPFSIEISERLDKLLSTDYTLRNSDEDIDLSVEKTVLDGSSTNEQMAIGATEAEYESEPQDNENEIPVGDAVSNSNSNALELQVEYTTAVLEAIEVDDSSDRDGVGKSHKQEQDQNAIEMDTLSESFPEPKAQVAGEEVQEEEGEFVIVPTASSWWRPQFGKPQEKGKGKEKAEYFVLSQEQNDTSTSSAHDNAAYYHYPSASAMGLPAVTVLPTLTATVPPAPDLGIGIAGVEHRHGQRYRYRYNERYMNLSKAPLQQYDTRPAPEGFKVASVTRGSTVTPSAATTRTGIIHSSIPMTSAVDRLEGSAYVGKPEGFSSAMLEARTQSHNHSTRYPYAQGFDPGTSQYAHVGLPITATTATTDSSLMLHSYTGPVQTAQVAHSSEGEGDVEAKAKAMVLAAKGHQYGYGYGGDDFRYQVEPEVYILPEPIRPPSPSPFPPPSSVPEADPVPAANIQEVPPCEEYPPDLREEAYPKDLKAAAYPPDEKEDAYPPDEKEAAYPTYIDALSTPFPDSSSLALPPADPVPLPLGDGAIPEADVVPLAEDIPEPIPPPEVGLVFVNK